MATLIVSANTIGDYAGDSTDVADTFLFGHTSGSYQTTNYGSDTRARVTRWDSAFNDRRVQLLYFDLSSLPSGCTINSVSLGLYCISQDGGDTDDIRRLLVAWVESEATWIIRSAGNNWATAGAQGDGTDRNSTIIGVVPNGTGWQVANDSGLVTWVQGVVDEDWSNYGLVLQNTSEDWFKENNYHSSEGTNGYRPYLSIDYTEGGAHDITGAGNISSAEVLGSPGLSADISAAGIPSAEAIGALLAGLGISGGSIPSEEAFGLPVVSDGSSVYSIAGAGGIVSLEVFGYLMVEAVKPPARYDNGLRAHPIPEHFMNRLHGTGRR